MSVVSTDEGVRWTRYVAVGDSFTEGLWDSPDGAAPADPSAPLRGWADVLAARLSARRVAAGDEPLEYANLAIRGRLLRPILTEQVPAALGLKPDLVSLIGGGNDILRPAADVDRLARDLESAVVRLREAGVDVLLGTGVDTVDSGLLRATRARVATYNTHIWSIAHRHGAHVLDLWGMRSLRDWRMWAEDRIHLTTDGHARVAQAALVALGLPPDEERWDDPLAPQPPTPRLDRLRGDARWAREHVYPWATRRLRGRSSGDTRAPKRPAPAPVTTDAG
ncbi:SGNH/GDSL hydrolase family protein [Cellulomonas palmilytica]|uniref:SGNH/GDSL hydrolase family protein n=1 Tax=Cellulomonas palmilytica TaxID=2608402 RepID=UPI001F338DBF|nr:SGNH/GDSL hydrolase family protein [Cellulomonas palmilytica]UJP40955.1 SGNH/GDSL hydrolase family protein [Cellulomonas palmilytica]